MSIVKMPSSWDSKLVLIYKVRMHCLDYVIKPSAGHLVLLPRIHGGLPCLKDMPITDGGINKSCQII